MDDIEPTFLRAMAPGFSRYLPLPDPYTRDDAARLVDGRLARSWDREPSFSITLDAVQRLLRGERRDEVVYGVLRKEFDARRQP